LADTEREVRASLLYRLLTRVYLERVPDAKTLIRLSGVVGPEGVEAIHRRIVEMARERSVIAGHQARVDTTVTETNIHYPTDSSLLADSVRVLTRAIKRIEAATGVVGRKVRDRRRATTRRVLEIGRAARSRVGDARQQMGRSYQRLLAIARATAREAERVVAEVSAGMRCVATQSAMLVVLALTGYLEQMLPLVGRVIAQTRARILGGDTHFAEKLLSLFEPHSEAIRKGKAAKPTEFGKLVTIQESEHQIITAYEVHDRRPPDVTLWTPALDRHIAIFNRPPDIAAGDRGFASAHNEDAAAHRGVRRVILPRPGRKTPARRAHERQRWFRRGQRWRVGCEGRISVIKRRHGLRRCRYHGAAGTARWVGLGVIANNLVSTATFVNARATT
jgi:IS5 family transposase